MTKHETPKTSDALLETLLVKAAEKLRSVEPWTKDGRPAIAEVVGYLDDLHARLAHHHHPLLPRSRRVDA